jgi:hypothetical protein
MTFLNLRAASAISILAALGALTACGGGDSEDSSNTSAAAAAAPATTTDSTSATDSATTTTTSTASTSSTSAAATSTTTKPATTTTAATTSTTSSGSSSSATPLASAFSVVGTQWGVDAPSDADQAANVYSYPEKTYGKAITNINQLPTITNASNGGGVRFGPTTEDGLPAVYRNIRQGDVLYYQGNRSGIAYDGTSFLHGVDYWVAFAVKFGTEWVQANSGGSGDRQAIWDTHSVPYSPGYNGTAAEITWAGGMAGTYSGKELWMSVPQWGSGNAAYLYNWAANRGGWQRIIIHYRSGSSAQSPVMDMWVANGAGAFSQLAKAVDPYTGSAWNTTPAWGDPVGGGNDGPGDYMKVEIYKWTTGAYGNIPNRSIWMSDVFLGKGTNMYDNAVAALAAYAK